MRQAGPRRFGSVKRVVSAALVMLPKCQKWGLKFSPLQLFRSPHTMRLATVYLCKPKPAALKFKGLYAALAALVASGVPQTEDVFV